MARPARGLRLRVPDGVARLLRGLHPELRRKVKTALQENREERGRGKPLRDELMGLRSYRVSRFRIVYRKIADRTLEVVAVGPP